MVGVTGGSGGAGATTFACALGQVAARSAAGRSSSTPTRSARASTGCSGSRTAHGVRWDGLCQTTGRLSARSLREALPRREGLGALTWHAGPPGHAPGVRRPRGAVGRPPRPRPGGRRPAAHRRPGGRRGGRPLRPAAGRGRARPSPGVASAVRACARHPDPTSVRLVLRGSGVEPQAVARATGVPVLARDGRPARPRRGDRPRPRARCGRGAAPRPGRGRGARPALAAAGPRHEPSCTASADLEAVRDRLARSPGELTPHRVAEALRETGPAGRRRHGARRLRDAAARRRRRRAARAAAARRRDVTDVLVNGPDRVYLDRGAGPRARPRSRFPDDEAVRRLAQRLAALGGRRLDDATPYVDLRLPDGTRFHAVLAPLSRPGHA